MSNLYPYNMLQEHCYALLDAASKELNERKKGSNNKIFWNYGLVLMQDFIDTLDRQL